MEAVWTRFLPVYAVVGEWLRDGAIGRVRSIQSTFCYHSPFDAAHRNYDPLQAGGALLDLGIYNITMARWVLAAALGECPPVESVHASGTVGPSGVDHRTSATLEFSGGAVAQFTCGFEMTADNTLAGRAANAASSSSRNSGRRSMPSCTSSGKEPVDRCSRPHRMNGFEDEIEEAMAQRRGTAPSRARASRTRRPSRRSP